MRPPENLEELQRLMVDAFVAGRGGDLSGRIQPGGRLTVEGAIGVHRNGYFARLTEALGETYESLWWVLGDEGFFSLCRRYIEAHPSNVPNLADYGHEMERFLWSPACPERQEAPFLPELARFEWSFKELFHQQARPGLNPQTLQSRLEESREPRLELGGAWFSAGYLWAVRDIWNLRREKAVLRSSDPWARPQTLLAWRKEGECYVTEIPECERQLLGRLNSGQSLSSALGWMANTHPDWSPEDAQAFFARLAEAGMVTGISDLGEVLT